MGYIILISNGGTMSTEWFYIQQWRRNRELREQEEKLKKEQETKKDK